MVTAGVGVTAVMVAVVAAGERVEVGESFITGIRSSWDTGVAVSLTAGVTTLERVFSELVEMVDVPLKKVVQKVYVV